MFFTNGNIQKVRIEHTTVEKQSPRTVIVAESQKSGF